MKMEIKISKRFLMLPYEAQAQRKKLILKMDQQIKAELDIRLGSLPDFFLPYDLMPFIGEEMEMEIQPDAVFAPIFSDQPDISNLYKEKYRPAAHFSAAYGWINDPNGLVFYEGKYHLFFQHNPAGPIWDNMHWGHAVSRDLLHWQQLDDILFPDDTGTMFSGCAVIDESNVSGLKCNDHAPLLLFYTAAGGTSLRSRGTPFTQRLAYSVDGGQTFQKFHQVMVPHIAAENRDPKVIFCEEMDCYLMALYLQGRDFMLLSSKDLLHWKELQRIRIEDDDECPDIYPLSLDGEQFWVMTAAHDRYLIGRISNDGFTPIQPAQQLQNGQLYAAQTFFGIPAHRRIRFSWNKALIPGMPFQGAMSTPHDMFLRRIHGRIHLCAQPIAEFDQLHDAALLGTNQIHLPGKAHDLHVTLPAEGCYTLNMLGLQMTIDVAQGVIKAGQETVPFHCDAKELPLRIIQDVHSTEFFINHGEKILCLQHIADYFLHFLSCPGARIQGWSLKNIWE